MPTFFGFVDVRVAPLAIGSVAPGDILLAPEGLGLARVRRDDPVTGAFLIPHSLQVAPSTDHVAFWPTAACPASVPADLDHDCDVDHDDLDDFINCAAGPAVPLAPGCQAADLDGDNDGDQTDFATVQQCFSGRDVPADPACDQ